MNEIDLSIVVPTYGHEKYIAEALDGILKQKTKYSYEVLVGEDASPDGTRAILKEYEKKYPDKFKMFYRKINMNSTPGLDNSLDLKRRSIGKYIIILEGDDFWIDENKIEEQIDFLESHPDYIAVSHNCEVVDQNSEVTGEKYPECKDETYSYRHLLFGIMPGQTATVLMRNLYRESAYDTSLLEQGLTPGDKLTNFVLLNYGKIHCIQKKMSAYRHIIREGSSYSATYTYDFDYEENWHLKLLEYARTTNKREAIVCAETLYLMFIYRAYGHKKIEFGCFLKKLKHVKNKPIVVYKYITYLIYKHKNLEK